MIDSTTFLDKDGNALNYLTQWDINQTIVIPLESFSLTKTPEVHFCNSASDTALIVEPTVENESKKIYAKIPNILLTQSLPLDVYVYYIDDSDDTSMKTVRYIRIPVNKRKKPDDYHYQESGEIVYNTERIKKLENAISNIDGGIGVYRAYLENGARGKNLMHFSDGTTSEKFIGKELRFLEYCGQRYNIDNETGELSIIGRQTNGDGGILYGTWVNTSGEQTPLDRYVLNTGELLSTNSDDGTTISIGRIVYKVSRTPKITISLVGFEDINSNSIIQLYDLLVKSGTSYNPNGITFSDARCEASGALSVSGGSDSKATGTASFAFGQNTTASGWFAIALGAQSNSTASYAISIGTNCSATAENSIAIGTGSSVNSSQSISMNGGTVSANAPRSISFGGIVNSACSVAFFTNTVGDENDKSQIYCYAEGFGTIAKGMYNHTEGNQTQTTKTAIFSHAEGNRTKTEGESSHVEGDRGYIGSTGYGGHAEGLSCEVYSHGGHAEGCQTKSGFKPEEEKNPPEDMGNHAEGNKTIAQGTGAHAEGISTKAQGYGAHAEGIGTVAYGYYSHAAGQYTTTSKQGQYAIGKYNNDGNNTNYDYVFMIGNGTGEEARSNAIAIDWQGKIYVNNSDTGVDILDLLNRVKALEEALDGLKLKKTTTSEYDSLETKDDNTVYFCTE